MYLFEVPCRRSGNGRDPLTEWGREGTIAYPFGASGNGSMQRFLEGVQQLDFAYRRRLQLGIAGTYRALGRDRFRAGDFAIDPLDLDFPGLDPAFEGYRIVQISDIHMGHWISPDRLFGVIDLVNQQNPDLVAITGDFVSYELDEIEDPLVTALSRIEAVDGTVGVLGNHDHWLDPERVREILRSGKVKELANDVYEVQRGGASLYIAGVDDIMVEADRLDLVLEKLPPEAPAILLAHEPDFAEQSAATGRFRLQLSGHSHGGQVVLPRLGPVFRGSRFLKYPNGAYQVGDMIQYTNRGIGTHVFRLRINCPPEITVISLRPS